MTVGPGAICAGPGCVFCFCFVWFGVNPQHSGEDISRANTDRLSGVQLTLATVRCFYEGSVLLENIYLDVV